MAPPRSMPSHASPSSSVPLPHLSVHAPVSSSQSRQKAVPSNVGSTCFARKRLAPGCRTVRSRPARCRRRKSHTPRCRRCSRCRRPRRRGRRSEDARRRPGDNAELAEVVPLAGLAGMELAIATERLGAHALGQVEGAVGQAPAAVRPGRSPRTSCRRGRRRRSPRPARRPHRRRPERSGLRRCCCRGCYRCRGRCPQVDPTGPASSTGSMPVSTYESASRPGRRSPWRSRSCCPRSRRRRAPWPSRAGSARRTKPSIQPYRGRAPGRKLGEHQKAGGARGRAGFPALDEGAAQPWYEPRP